MTGARFGLVLVLASPLMLVLACTGGAEEPGAGRTPSGSPSPAPAARAKTYSQRPALAIEPTKKYIATVRTVKGDFKIELRPDIASETVNSFVFLARDGYYDGVTFHRVIPGFVAQAGDPTDTGSGSPGYTLPAEFSDVPYERGTVGLARLSSDPNSGGSQFFIAYAAQVYDDFDASGAVSTGDVRLTDIGPYKEGSTVAEGDADIGSGLTTVSGLNGKYTVFGKVTEGMEVVDSLTPRDPLADPNAPPGDAITTIEISEQ